MTDKYKHRPKSSTAAGLATLEELLDVTDFYIRAHTVNGKPVCDPQYMQLYVRLYELYNEHPLAHRQPYKRKEE